MLLPTQPLTTLSNTNYTVLNSKAFELKGITTVMPCVPFSSFGNNPTLFAFLYSAKR